MKLSMITGTIVGALLLTVQTAQAADQLDDAFGATLVKTAQPSAAKPVVPSAAARSAAQPKHMDVTAKTVNVLVTNDGKPTMVLVEHTVDRPDTTNQSPATPPKPRVMELTW